MEKTREKLWNCNKKNQKSLFAMCPQVKIGKVMRERELRRQIAKLPPTRDAQTSTIVNKLETNGKQKTTKDGILLIVFINWCMTSWTWKIWIITEIAPFKDFYILKNSISVIANYSKSLIIYQIDVKYKF